MRTYRELWKVMEWDLSIFDGLDKDNAIKFKRWLPDNMHIYNSFVAYAHQLKQANKREYYSARAIWERLRWDSMTTENDDGHFKINGNYAPFVSWLVMEMEPELEGMFRKRTRGV